MPGEVPDHDVAFAEANVYAHLRHAVPAALVEEFNPLEPAVLAAISRLREPEPPGR